MNSSQLSYIMDEHAKYINFILDGLDVTNLETNVDPLRTYYVGITKQHIEFLVYLEFYREKKIPHSLLNLLHKAEELGLHLRLPPEMKLGGRTYSEEEEREVYMEAITAARELNSEMDRLRKVYESQPGSNIGVEQFYGADVKSEPGTVETSGNDVESLTDTNEGIDYNNCAETGKGTIMMAGIAPGTVDAGSIDEAVKKTIALNEEVSENSKTVSPSLPISPNSSSILSISEASQDSCSPKLSKRQADNVDNDEKGNATLDSVTVSSEDSDGSPAPKKRRITTKRK